MKSSIRIITSVELSDGADSDLAVPCAQCRRWALSERRRLESDAEVRGGWAVRVVAGSRCGEDEEDGEDGVPGVGHNERRNTIIKTN